MDKPAPSTHPLIEPIKQRWSPRAFDGGTLAASDLASLFEAARWAPSAFNAQPWRWILAVREEEAAFEQVLGCLIPWNRSWAQQAGALALAVASERFAHNDKPNDTALYDLGQACAQLAIQAASLGLFIHPMSGIEPETARERFGIPEGFSAVTALAIGRSGDPDSLPEEMREGERAPRERLPLDELVFTGAWGKAYPEF
jgi:nitroreductase